MLKSVVLKADLRLPLRHEKNYRDHLNPKEVGIAVAFAPKLTSRRPHARLPEFREPGGLAERW